MTRGQTLGIAFLAVALVVSGVAVVHAKNRSRVLFVELQQVRSMKDQADMDWGRLQLELATHGALGRVMSIAGARLRMRAPTAEQIVVVK